MGPVTVHPGNRITPAMAAHAHARVAELLDALPEPVLDATVRLSVLPDRAIPRPARARVSVRLRGRRIRAHAQAANPHGAVELMRARLAARLRTLDTDPT
ncbi:HPF/RaiA family ribosome-associated protein [Actinocorallia sp. A-T 12471]|uniref:HPF/RaiA family ribosome-associated protein n=1 Tax=Actinocorallia sp. A-T 12471 TaxID=3089813 RepID=UPI0029D238EB|nr:HPF/RaiA family ribosome-associated protein [Actinocorallia sp. A-T 12471]MDX6744327.1 HPF/RaiA family ribosome-associated protein [Actinocorallia sp. A-T 12471]